MGQLDFLNQHIAIGLECGGRLNNEQAHLWAIAIDRRSGEASLQWQTQSHGAPLVAFICPGETGAPDYLVGAVLKRVGKVIEILSDQPPSTQIEFNKPAGRKR